MIKRNEPFLRHLFRFFFFSTKYQTRQIFLMHRLDPILNGSPPLNLLFEKQGISPKTQWRTQ